MLRYVDKILNDITVYRLLAYGLTGMAGLSIVLGFTGILGIDGWEVMLGLGVSITASYLANFVISRAWDVPTNNESWYITGLIVFFVLSPPATLAEAGILALACMVAVASKFLITWNSRHIFNPAAFGAFVITSLELLPAIWWVGSSSLFPVALIGGFMVVRKIRRFALVGSFVLTALLVTVIMAVMDKAGIGGALQAAIISSPLLFLGTIMLTEPATMPARRTQQVIFGAGVGLLYTTAFNIGPLGISPELALLIGNVYAFAVNPRYRLRLKLLEVQRIGNNVSNYVFESDRKANYLAGQYMEFTLAHMGPDMRGNRRTLSIASSPTEPTIQIGVKFHAPSSSFKQSLQNLKPGSVVYAGQTMGDFILPSDHSQKLLFLAAGIGITPFRSMLKYLADSGQQRDVTLIYAVPDAQDLAYIDVLRTAVQQGIRVIPLLTKGDKPEGWQGMIGKLGAVLIADKVPDYKDRHVYISGPNSMVDTLAIDLQKAGVNRARIKTDHFSGY